MYAIVENGVVKNVAVADREYAEQQGWVEYPKGVSVGWLFDGTSFSKPPRNIDAEWEAVRQKRNTLLAESDSHVLPDRWAAMTVEKQQGWTNYRQALRDIPQAYDDPADVVWPSPPA